MNWKKIASVAYPIFVVAALVLVARREANAGQVRKLEITPDQPGVVRLAFGRTTAISFSVRPEKVVPGSPQAIEVNFLGKDITVRPLTSKPGNLLVYTKSSRFVLLFLLSSDAQYDDVVKVAPAFAKTPLRLLQDAFRIVTLEVRVEPKSGPVSSTEVPVSVRADDRTIEGIEFKDALQPYEPIVCPGCIFRREERSIRLTCSTAIEEIRCRSPGAKVFLRKGSS